jgi:peroxiredoxin
VVGVNTDTPDQGDPRAFAMAHNLTYPIVQDVSGEASRAFAVESLPTLVVVSRTGKITAVRTGMTDDAELERLIRQAL